MKSDFGIVAGEMLRECKKIREYESMTPDTAADILHGFAQKVAEIDAESVVLRLWDTNGERRNVWHPCIHGLGVPDVDIRAKSMESARDTLAEWVYNELDRHEDLFDWESEVEGTEETAQ